MISKIYRLREARKLRGMTVDEAAKGLGFSKQYLSKIEINGCQMDSEKLLKFAKFYNVTVDYLIPNKDKPKIELGEIKWCRMPKYV